MLLCYQQEELSEQQIRISLVEKKLDNKNREGEEELAKLQRKLDESALQLKKKEKYVVVTEQIKIIYEW